MRILTGNSESTTDIGLVIQDRLDSLDRDTLLVIVGEHYISVSDASQGYLYRKSAGTWETARARV